MAAPPTGTAEGAARLGHRQSRSLGRSRYENFSVGSAFLPRAIRQDLFNIYAFCRLADDIADEAAGGVSRSERLDHWQEQLEEAAVGNAEAPLFAALGGTIRRHGLSTEPFLDLLTAFRQDLTVTRYPTWDDLLVYCRLSANPVGRLVLAVCGLKSDDLFAHSDKICTALQLANHWQDVASDYERGRIYVPGEVMSQFEVAEEVIPGGRPTPSFRLMMRHLVERAERLFKEGKPLLTLVGKPLSPQIYLYWGGGMAALQAIRAADGDVLTTQRKVGIADRLRLGSGALVRWAGLVGNRA